MHYWRRIGAVALPLTLAAVVAMVPATSSAGSSSAMHSGRKAVSGGVQKALAVHQGLVVPGRGRLSPARPVLPNVRASNMGASP